MPRANRYHLPGYVWHITERCHRKQFLLKFVRDRRAWMGWLYQARKRFGLCVLDYTVTSNHIHLLVLDQGRGEVSSSMQLIAGRTGQAYNDRKNRRGAFWGDRYHASAVDSGEYLAQCLVYIDLNMVRAGVVAHPEQWETGGYHEIRAERARRRIVDRRALAKALGLDNIASLADAHAQWIADALVRGGTRATSTVERECRRGKTGVCRAGEPGIGWQVAVPADRASRRHIYPSGGKRVLRTYFAHRNRRRKVKIKRSSRRNLFLIGNLRWSDPAAVRCRQI